jgi:hypothetical protein
LNNFWDEMNCAHPRFRFRTEGGILRYLQAPGSEEAFEAGKDYARKVAQNISRPPKADWVKDGLLQDNDAVSQQLVEAAAGLSRTAVTGLSCRPMDSADYETWPQGITVMLKNLPPQYTRDTLKELLQSEGFLHHCNFMCLPINFRSAQNVGNAFLNLTSEEQTKRFFTVFEGFRRWAVDSDQAASVCWSNVTGLSANIERYRNSPVMRDYVPDSFKPILLSGGQEFPLPRPTDQLRRLRCRRNHGIRVQSPAPPGLELLEDAQGMDTQQECIGLLKNPCDEMRWAHPSVLHTFSGQLCADPGSLQASGSKGAFEPDRGCAKKVAQNIARPPKVDWVKDDVLQDKAACLSRTAVTGLSCQPMDSANYETWPQGLTVMLKNLPPQYTRDVLKELLQSEGFLDHCNFLYLPMNFQSAQNVGNAFLNLASEEQTRRFFTVFEGFRRWAVDFDQAASVCWSNVTGLSANIERYRNSPVMRECVPDSFKPILLSGGQEFPLPRPTDQLRRLRCRKNHGIRVESPHHARSDCDQD